MCGDYMKNKLEGVKSWDLFKLDLKLINKFIASKEFSEFLMIKRFILHLANTLESQTIKITESR